MFRRTDIILIAGAIAMAAYTYSVKTETKGLRHELAAVNDEIAKEENAIRILRADWSLLTSPQRIQTLVGVYAGQLDLEPGDPKRSIAIADIPMRPAPVEPELDIDTLLARISSGTTDPMMTGSVVEMPFATPDDTATDLPEIDE